jgi:hypothetical protein
MGSARPASVGLHPKYCRYRRTSASILRPLLRCGHLFMQGSVPCKFDALILVWFTKDGWGPVCAVTRTFRVSSGPSKYSSYSRETHIYHQQCRTACLPFQKLTTPRKSDAYSGYPRNGISLFGGRGCAPLARKFVAGDPVDPQCFCCTIALSTAYRIIFAAVCMFPRRPASSPPSLRIYLLIF